MGFSLVRLRYKFVDGLDNSRCWLDDLPTLWRYVDMVENARDQAGRPILGKGRRDESWIQRPMIQQTKQGVYQFYNL